MGWLYPFISLWSAAFIYFYSVNSSTVREPCHRVAQDNLHKHRQKAKPTLVLKGTEPKHISDQVRGCARAVSSSLISNQGQFALAQSRALPHGYDRLEALHVPFPSQPASRGSPRGVGSLAGIQWVCLPSEEQMWTQFLQPQSFIWQRNWCLSTRQARHSLVSNQGCVHKQKQHAVSTCTRRVPFSRHLSLFSMFSLLNNKLLVV